MFTLVHTDYVVLYLCKNYVLLVICTEGQKTTNPGDIRGGHGRHRRAAQYRTVRAVPIIYVHFSLSRYEIYLWSYGLI